MSACVPTRHDHSSRSSRPSRSLGVKRPHSPPPRGGRFRIAGADVSASITVFLLAIPMSLGLAVAMGAPLEAGLLSAAVGGIVAGLLGGTPLQVSGPSAGLTVVTAQTIQVYGWRTTCAITIGAGLLQLVLGSLRAARSALAVSPAIVHGTLAGIGVAIALAQLHIVLGGSPQSSAISNVLHLPEQLARVDPAAPLIGGLTVAVLVLWPLLPGRAGRLLRRAPAALASVALATAAAAWAAPSIARVDLPSWSSHALPELPHGPVFGLATAVFTMMLVASLESLLAAVAVDKLAADRNRAHAAGSPMAPGPDAPDVPDRSDAPAAPAGPVRLAPPPLKRSDLDRELRAQGIANMVSGLLGGLAVSGGAVRSSANVRAGATGRASTVLHGVWILLASGLLVATLELIPLAALGALVMMVGLKMVSLAHIRNVHKHREFLVYGATIAGVLVVGVLKGVAIGIAVAVAVALHRLGRTRITISTLNGQHHVLVRGQLTFLAVPRLSRMLAGLPQGADAVVELDGFFMDHAAYEAIQDWSNAHTAHGGQVAFAGRSGGRIAEPAAAAHSCCRPWTPWRNHHCHDRPEHAPPPQTADSQPRPASTTGPPTTPPAIGVIAPAPTSAPPHPGTGAPADTAPQPAHRPRPSPPAPTAPEAPATPATSASAQAPPAASPAPTPPAPQSAPAPHRAAAEHAGPTGPDAAESPTSPAAHGGHGGHRLVRGLSSFQRDTAPLVRAELARLAREGQRPSQLFITCADSRLVTSMITASGPGDLFTVRNIGNLVPLPGPEQGDHSVGAAIEYAVDVLGVESITVCGHSGCGAMNALLANAPAPSPHAPDTSLARWLRHGLPSLGRMTAAGEVRARIAGREPADTVEQLCLTNVMQQLDHLRAHPSVARRIAEGTLQLHGMYFHVAEAQSYLLTEAAGTKEGRAAVFDPVTPARPAELVRSGA
ncbi:MULTISPECIES: bifunctional SulP family inorganic anion transporter/carbonic anhydrase [unclassified Streptomyces]|uniref:bifunctional SulP family inorganic anion transporter/carbonic anhydrase n=1 Tax=unclassified Streptomyces TaxID=2593676 RepID=UPI000DADF2E5|nr:MULTISPECIES: SulP family inorganic anion transporter [unclassified Streptomyces]PZT72639.1 transporter [Streptomyces sp. AC1-42T]PZT81042.1 transporter [Streptomyces sp. AC1-42W]